MGGKNLGSHTTVKPWRGLVSLESFVPPVQAALSIFPSKQLESGSKEYFPRIIPRMRAFSPKVAVMNSKAKPKRQAKAVERKESFVYHLSANSTDFDQSNKECIWKF